MNGVLVIDKPAGITSHDTVTRVKRLLKAKKAGHTGTLDPLATGVLPVCLNEATKIAQFLVNDHKEYEARLILGLETDTQDVTGKVISETDRIPEDHDQIIKVFKEFTGSILQKPPVFSAVKHKGVPLHRWARRGVVIDRTEREVSIFRMNVLKIALPYVSFDVWCSKGTYIRTLCADIGSRLGCGANLVGLRRIRSGAFHIKDSYSLESLEELVKKGSEKEEIIPLDKALSNLPQIEVNENLARRIKHGNQLLFGDLKDISLTDIQPGQTMRINSLKDGLIAVAESMISYPLTGDNDKKDRICRLVRVFNT